MSDLLNQASLIMVPSGYKEDTVYSVVPSDGSGDLSFTRASNGTRINSAGLVEVTPWNLASYSEDFTNAAWSKANTTITANDTTAPNGTTTADKVISSAVNDEHLVYYFESQYFNQVVTLSAYVKKSDYRYAILRSYTNSAYRISVFDLDNGVITSQDLGASTIESVGNGWYRISTTFTTPSSTFSYQYAFSATQNFSYLGDGTSGNYLWGAQLNIGSTAKPYFPTTDRLNVPRLTYQNGGGGCPSLLLEKQSTNLLTYSEQFDNAGWTKYQGGTITANSVTSPDGTQNADTLTVASGQTYSGIYQSVSASSDVYTVSIFAKYNTKRWLFFFDASASAQGWFDIQNGVLGTIPSGHTGTIENFGNGWYRLTFKKNTAVIPSFFQIGLVDADGSSTPSSNGSSYIWGAQLEASSYPTSYIPTTSSSATRVADACFKSTSLLANQTIACFFVDVVINQQPDNYAGIMEMRNGTTCDFYMLQYQASNTIEFRARGSNGVENTVAVAPALGRKKIAMYRNGDRLAVFINGVKQADQTSATAMSAFANSAQTFYYNFDPAFGTYSNCININESIIFAGNALTDAELISLTTI